MQTDKRQERKKERRDRQTNSKREKKREETDRQTDRQMSGIRKLHIGAEKAKMRGKNEIKASYAGQSNARGVLNASKPKDDQGWRNK